MTLAIKAKKCLDSPLKGEKLFMIMLVHSPLFANLLFKNYVLCLCDALESCTYLLHNDCQASFNICSIELPEKDRLSDI